MGVSENKGSACSQLLNENQCKPFVERDFRVTLFVASYCKRSFLYKKGSWKDTMNIQTEVSESRARSIQCAFDDCRNITIAGL